jgi:hypothetical protein
VEEKGKYKTGRGKKAAEDIRNQRKIKRFTNITETYYKEGQTAHRRNSSNSSVDYAFSRRPMDLFPFS